MGENPFTYGNPISNPERFFGRQLEVKQIFSRLCNAEAESSSVVGERRIGKTSLLQHLMQPSVRREYGLDHEKEIFLYFDLQMVGERDTPARMWQRFIRQIAQHCQCAGEEIKALTDEIRAADDVDNFLLSDLFSTISAQGFHITFLLDEFEKITGNPNFSPDFFYTLRSLAIHNRLTLVTSSRQELIELTHSSEIRSSPFFNIFANINLRQFSQDEALTLIQKNLSGSGVQFNEAEQRVILQLAGTHPFFLQAACHFLFAAYQEKLDTASRLKYLRKEFSEEVSGHLKNYWQDSNNPEKIVLLTLALLDRQSRSGARAYNSERIQDLFAHAQQTIHRLEKRSLLVEQPGGYALFNQFCADWVVREIADTMQDAQGYENWLASNPGVLERLSEAGRQPMAAVLPKIAASYRELVVDWAADPKNVVPVASLLQAVLNTR